MNDCVCTYWEGPVTWLERLSVNSMLDVGYRVRLFTTGVDALKASGIGGDIYDIRDVLPDDCPAYAYKSQPAGMHVFSDIARIALLKARMGIWADADCLFLRKIQTSDLIMAWVHAKRINNAVLFIPPEAPVLNDYFKSITAIPLRAPWVDIRRRMQRELEIAFGGTMPARAHKSSIGPRALTYFVKKHRLESRALPAPTFYPVRDAQAHELVDPDDRAAAAKIEAETVIIHAWQSTLRRFGALAKPPPPTSLFGRASKRLGV